MDELSSLHGVLETVDSVFDGLKEMVEKEAERVTELPTRSLTKKEHRAGRLRLYSDGS